MNSSIRLNILWGVALVLREDGYEIMSGNIFDRKVHGWCKRESVILCQEASLNFGSGSTEK